MKKTIRIAATILAGLMTATALPVSAAAARYYDLNGYGYYQMMEYTITNKTDAAVSAISASEGALITVDGKRGVEYEVVDAYGVIAQFTGYGSFIMPDGSVTIRKVKTISYNVINNSSATIYTDKNTAGESVYLSGLSGVTYTVKTTSGKKVATIKGEGFFTMPAADIIVTEQIREYTVVNNTDAYISGNCTAGCTMTISGYSDEIYEVHANGRVIATIDGSGYFTMPSANITITSYTYATPIYVPGGHLA